MTKYQQELSKEAEKLEELLSHYPPDSDESIQAIARYVLEVKSVAVKFGYACAQTDISFGLEIGVDIHIEELGYIEREGEDGDDEDEQDEDIECEFCSQTKGHAYGCPNNIDPFNNLLTEGFD